MPEEGAVLKIRKKYSISWKAFCSNSQLYHTLAGFRLSFEYICRHWLFLHSLHCKKNNSFIGPFMGQWLMVLVVVEGHKNAFNLCYGEQNKGSPLRAENARTGMLGLLFPALPLGCFSIDASVILTNCVANHQTNLHSHLQNLSNLSPESLRQHSVTVS